MSETFDPYYVWLGIPANQRPVNHYRLLGLELFETDLTVIEHAADRQMVHIRQFQIGKHKDESQRLLNELASARVCLLNADSKTQYDKTLAASMPKSTPAKGGSKGDAAPSRPGGDPFERPRRNQPTVAKERPRRASEESRPAAAPSGSAKAARATNGARTNDAAEFTFEVPAEATRPKTTARGTRDPKSGPNYVLIGAAIAGVLVVAVVIGVLMSSGSEPAGPTSQPNVAKNPGPAKSTSPAVDKPPLLAAIGDQSAKQQQPWDWILDAEAPEGFRTGDLRFQLEKSPQGMQVDPRKGRMTWLPGPDAPRGPHDVVVKVQIEGKPNLTASRSFRITVVPGDTPKPTPKPTAVADASGMTLVEFVPTSQKESQHWRYTTEQPPLQGPRQWFNVTYNDGTWKAGPGGFGIVNDGPVNGIATPRTNWSTPQIWLRREFDINESILIDPHVMVFHDDDVMVYINGTKIFERPGLTAAYLPLRLDRFGRPTLRWGRNLFAVTCRHTDGARFIDVGLASRRLPLAPAQQTELDAAGKVLRDLGCMMVITSDNGQAMLRIEGDSTEPPTTVFQHVRRVHDAAHFRVFALFSHGRNFTEADMTAMVESPVFSITNSVLLEKCDIAERAFGELANVKNLQVLTLKKTKWPRQAARHFAPLTRLDILDLSYTSVTDEEMQYIAGMKDLSQLDLSYTTVSDRGLAQLTGLTRLKAMSVFGTRVTVHGAKRAFPNVEIHGAGQQ